LRGGDEGVSLQVVDDLQGAERGVTENESTETDNEDRAQTENETQMETDPEVEAADEDQGAEVREAVDEDQEADVKRLRRSSDWCSSSSALL